MQHLLEVGDRIYCFCEGQRSGRYVVERVTPVKAYASGIRFRRITSESGVVEAMNGDDHTYYRYYNSEQEKRLK